MAEQDFEVKFSQLVNGMISEKVPALSKYKVGFQVLDKDEEGTRAVGVNAFVVNNVWIYIPVFFLDGSIKGLDMMYLKQNDIFVPAQDSWIASIKAQGETLLGKSTKDLDTNDEAVDAESVTFADKIAFKQSDDLLTREELIAMLRVIPDKAADSFIEKVANMGNSILRKFVVSLHKSPEFANAILRYHPPKELQKIAEVSADMAKAEVVKEEKDNVKIISKMTDAAAKTLTDCEKKMLVQNGVFVQDNRKSFSKLFEQKVRSDVCQNPTCSGIYDVLLNNGNYTSCFIVMLGNKGSCSRQAAIIKIEEPGVYHTRAVNEVFCRNIENISPDEIRKLIGGNSVGKKVFAELMSEDNCGCSTALITLGAKTNIELSVAKYDQGSDDKIHARVVNGLGINKDSCDDIVLEFTDVDGKLSFVGDTLYVPKDARIFRKASWEKQKDLRLGNLSTIHSMIVKEANLSTLQVSSMGNLIQIRSTKGATGLIDKVAAVTHLVLKEGIYAGQAQQLLKEANRNKDKMARYYINYAPAYFNKTAANEEGGAIETNKTVGGKALDTELPKKAIDTVVKASEAGIKEVFDVTVLQQLINAADVSELRKDFITDMVKGMDKIGRMLFLFYWHNDEFENRYGKEDMDELEDSLKQAFTINGDLVLYLKEKMAYSPDSSDSLFGAMSEDIGTADAQA